MQVRIEELESEVERLKRELQEQQPLVLALTSALERREPQTSEEERLKRAEEASKSAQEEQRRKQAEKAKPAGADANSRDENGWTPLHNAAHWGNEAVVQMLLKAGADVKAVNKDGWTPLHHAVSKVSRPWCRCC